MGELTSTSTRIDSRATDRLVDRLADDMGRRWRLGERPLAEEYFARHPELMQQPKAALELIYEEYCLRGDDESGDTAADLLSRFPAWERPLRAMLECHRLLSTEAPQFPAAGERLGEHQLVCELGRGAHGRVFLATEPSLADRLVVVKVAPRDSAEHLSLARLQHTHIVPVYTVFDDDSRGVRAVCMPFFGGATLERILNELQANSPATRTGADLLSALERAQVVTSSPVAGPACSFFGSVDYTRAACWIGACLADALNYAHERGFVHLDVKPSNVLLAADGQPMLLDFHLARGPLRAGEPAPLWLGGTPAYMAPEQRAALDAVRQAGEIAIAVDGRADQFSLGVLLAEMLVGIRPEGPVSVRWLMQRNSGVPRDVAAAIARSTASDPADRFVSAGALADALRQSLRARAAHGPSMTPTSLVRRGLFGRVPTAAVLAVALVASLGVVHVARQSDAAWQALQNGRDQMHEGHYEEAAALFRLGTTLTSYLPFVSDLRSTLAGELYAAQQADALSDLHTIVEQLREIFSAERLTLAEARSADALCETCWGHRADIVDRMKLPMRPQIRRQAKADLLELAVLRADLQSYLVTDAAAAHRKALDFLNEAGRLLGPDCVLDHERHYHLTAVGSVAEAKEAAQRFAATTPRFAWHYLALGRTALRAGDPDRAAEYFDQALALDPQDFWIEFYRGKAALVRGRSEVALDAFSACVALSPMRATCYDLRGLAYQKLRQADRAKANYDQALALDSRCAAAMMHRGQLEFEEKHFDLALADFHSAELAGADPAAVSLAIAYVYLARGERSAAMASLDSVLQHAPHHAEARALRESLAGTGRK